MPVLSSQRFLTAYSAVITVVFAVTVFSGLTAAPSKTQFDEIGVHRINVVEPDGTLRLVISNKANFPGSFIKGKEVARPDRKTAGLLFVDDEGTEDGGLIWGGMKDKDGRVSTHGHLSFDRYMQDQVFSIDAEEGGGRRAVSIAISDRGDYPITDLMDFLPKIEKLPEEQQQAELKKFRATHPGDHRRITLQRAPDASAALRLRDTEGRERVVIQVNPDGSPLIQLLDEKGQVISQLPPKK